VEKLWRCAGGYRRAPVSARTRTSPAVTEDAVELSVPDGRFRSVALVHELRRPRVVPFERRGGRCAAAPVPTTITCGTAEENLDDNRVLAGALPEHGFPARLVEHPDAHDWVAWRDALHPHVGELVLRSLR